MERPKTIKSKGNIRSRKFTYVKCQNVKMLLGFLAFKDYNFTISIPTSYRPLLRKYAVFKRFAKSPRQVVVSGRAATII